jgi:hypothetical protein
MPYGLPELPSSGSQLIVSLLDHLLPATVIGSTSYTALATSGRRVRCA